MASTSDLRPGLVINFNNELHQIVSFEHRTPGNLRAFYQVKMRHLKSGRMIENRFRSGEELDVVRLEQRDFQYLYNDGDYFVFMDNQTYDQINLSPEIIGKQSKFLIENMQIKIIFHENTALMVELPPHVILKVTETTPGFKGDTVNAAMKPATVETGHVINVPLFINEGDEVKIDTRTGDYIERAK
jgi:elongation factor P